MTAADLGALARRAQAGDSAARHELLVELYGAVRKHVYLILGGGAIADDAVQEAMIALHRGLASFRGDTASPRTWALAIATRIALADRAIREWPGDALVSEVRELRCRALRQLGRGGECGSAPPP